MTNRATRLDAVLILVAAILGVVWYSIPETTSDRQARLGDWSGVNARPPSSITIQRGDMRLVLTRIEGSSDASRYAAKGYAGIATDPAAVDRLIGALAHLETVRPVASQDARQGLERPIVTIELDGPDGKRSVALGAGAVSPAAARYAQLGYNGQTQIVVLAASTATAIDIEPLSLLEHRVFDWVPSELRSVELRSTHGSVRLERSTSGMWSVISPPVGRARREAVQKLLLTLTGLSVTHFVEPKALTLPQGGADFVEVALRAQRDQHNVDVRLKIGGHCPAAEKDRLLIREGSERMLGCVDVSVLEALAPKASDLADNAAFSLHGDEVERLEVSGLGPTWTLTRDGAAFRLNGNSNQKVALLAGNSLLESIAAVRGRNVGTCRFVAKHVGPMLSLRSYVIGNDGPTDQRIQWDSNGTTDGRRLCRDDGIEVLISPDDAPTLDIDQSMLKDPTLLSVAVEAITEVDLSGPAGHQRLRTNADGGFGATTPSLGPVDNVSADTLRELLAQLRAARWLPQWSGEPNHAETTVNVDFRVATSPTAAMPSAATTTVPAAPASATSHVTPHRPRVASVSIGGATSLVPTRVRHLRLTFRASQPTVGWLDDIPLPFVVEPQLADLVQVLALDRSMLGLTNLDRAVTLSRGTDQIRLERAADGWAIAGNDSAHIDPTALVTALEKLRILSIEAASPRRSGQIGEPARKPLTITYATSTSAGARIRLRYVVGPALQWRGQSVHRISTDVARVDLIVRNSDLVPLVASFLPAN